MNPIQKALTWIDVLLNPALSNGIRKFKAGKHAGGSKPSPDAQKKRQLRNKRQRQARQRNQRRMKA